MGNLNPVSTPLDSKINLVMALPDEPAVDTNLSQQKIGSLMYLVTCTHPDLAHAVSVLSQFSSHPLEEKNITRRLNGYFDIYLVPGHTGLHTQLTPIQQTLVQQT